MKSKALLLKRIEREQAYLEKQEVGTKEYDASMERMNVLEEKLAKLEQAEIDRKNQVKKDTSDWVKFGISTAVPVAMSLLILKWEETGSVTTALRAWITNNVPRK